MSWQHPLPLGRRNTPGFRTLAVVGLALTLGVPLAETSGAVETASAQAEPPARVAVPDLPVNVSADLALIRFRPNRPLPEAELAASQTWADLLRRMTNHGRADVIHRAVRDFVCAPAARLEFRQLESRPAFILDTGRPLPRTNVFGLSLATDFRWLPAMAPGGQPFVLLEWSGSWTGSVRLYSRWEALAVRAFSAAKTLPGITYDRVEEDEDGFVNTGGTTDLGGLFRRKKNQAKPRAPAKSKSAKNGATAAITDPDANASGEPDYQDESVVETVSLSGQWLGTPGGMIIRRHPLTSEPDAGELILVLTVGAGP